MIYSTELVEKDLEAGAEEKSVFTKGAFKGKEISYLVKSITDYLRKMLRSSGVRKHEKKQLNIFSHRSFDRDVKSKENQVNLLSTYFLTFLC